MRRRLKLIAIAIGLIGAVAGLVDLLGCFRNAEREAIARLLVQTQDEIPRSTPGFELFLGAFPPPNGIEPTEVTAIADKILRYNSRSDVGSSVSYVANGARTSPIASFSEIENWASSTIYGWVSWLISTTGWALYAFLELTEPRARAA